MRIIRDKNRSFDLDDFLQKPLFAHLATVSELGPRESPVWFHWEEDRLWIIGTPDDTFPVRIQKEPKCAIGIIEFNPRSGLVLHAGFRGKALVKAYNQELANRLLARYLGPDLSLWDPRFLHMGEENSLICFEPETVVIRDQSYNVRSRM